MDASSGCLSTPRRSITRRDSAAVMPCTSIVVITIIGLFAQGIGSIRELGLAVMRAGIAVLRAASAVSPPQECIRRQRPGAMPVALRKAVLKALWSR